MKLFHFYMKNTEGGIKIAEGGEQRKKRISKPTTSPTPESKGEKFVYLKILNISLQNTEETNQGKQSLGG